MPVFRLPEQDFGFPDPGLAEPDGLLAVGGDLSLRRLINAYALGIFPWYSEGSPILWWSPEPRCILPPEELHVPRSLRRVINSGRFRCTMDTAFEQVIAGCAGQRSNEAGEAGTWLVPEMIDAYIELHRIGIAHSAEAWLDGELAGGVYGVSLGGAFFGESMFFRVPDASKCAFVFCVNALRDAGFSLIDCQQETRNLLRFGAKGIPRQEFAERLERALRLPTLQGRWNEGLRALMEEYS